MQHFLRDEDLEEACFCVVTASAVIEMVTTAGEQRFSSYSTRESEIQDWDAASGEDLLAVLT